jgi:tyrosyl-tRNA synthetase
VPLIVNKSTGRKFGKSEEGAIWLDPAKTTPTAFYQFWINADDAGVEGYLKVFTELNKDEIDSIIAQHREDPGQRVAQKKLAEEVTILVHGKEATDTARVVTNVLIGVTAINEVSDSIIDALRKEIPAIQSHQDGSVIEALVQARLASSNTEARRFIQSNAISLNGVKTDRETFSADDFQNGRLLLRRGKAFKDSALVELN